MTVTEKGWKSSPAEIQWWFPEEESIPEPVVPIPLRRGVSSDQWSQCTRIEPTSTGPRWVLYAGLTISWKSSVTTIPVVTCQA